MLCSCLGLKYLAERRFREAANNRDIEMVERLINEGVTISSADSKKRTALHFASSKGEIEIVRLLLNHGADPNARDINGNTPLHLAACASHVNIVTILAEHGR